MSTQYRISIIDGQTSVLSRETTQAIKHLRFLAGAGDLSLMDAKMMVQQMIDNPAESVILESRQTESCTVRNAISTLAGLHLRVTLVLDETLALIKQAAFDALEMGEHGLSRDLIEVLINHGGK